MITKKQMGILSVFKKDIFAELTFSQIKKGSKQKSNSVVQTALKRFRELELLKAKKIADVTVYSLNMDSNTAMACLNLLNEAEIREKKLPKMILQAIQDRISRYTDFFTLIVFGSYAKQQAKKNSDLDIAVIVESEQTKKNIAPYLETIKRRETTAIDYHIFTREEMLEMLEAEDENLGKQIHSSGTVYYGLIPYYQAIKRKKNA
ncbi:MAG: nucleotidyltransferase domain-containing protein [Candidatus Woesearchaeota archaeon]